MKKLSYIFVAVAVSFLLTGCGLYKKYERKSEVPADVLGADGDDKPLGSVLSSDTVPTPMSWRVFFTDPQLLQLIEQALENNTDLHTARITVEKNEISLRTAKMAYLPSISFSPQGTLSKFDNNPWSRTYSLPLQVSWDVDIFGSVTNKKRSAKAVLLQSQCYEEAVRSNLVSTVAQDYYMLQMLDAQLDILTQTDSIWGMSLEMERTLWENGKVYSTAVNQLEASWLSVKTQIVDTRRSIRAIENSLCSILAIAPQHICRSRLGSYAMPSSIFDSVSAAMLRNRPDIRMADYMMEEAFYNIQSARSAFFPSLSLSGTVGWSNSGGGVVTNPGALLLNFMGQLTQPIFSQGKLRGNLKISKLSAEEAQKYYAQTVVDAGNDVNEAIADCQAAKDKVDIYRRQVSVLHDAFIGTHELMDNGKATYLEVLTAQEGYLNAQLSEVENLYDGAKALISLYIALGGGGE